MPKTPVKVKDGVPPKHWCQATLPAHQRPGTVYQCTCDKFYVYGEQVDLYGERDWEPTTPAKHEYHDYDWAGFTWRRCDRDGHPYYKHKLGTEKIGWFRKRDLWEWRVEK